MLKLLFYLAQVLLLTGLLVSLILDIPAWELIFPLKGLAFLVLLALDWSAFSKLTDIGIDHWEGAADTKAPLPPATGETPTHVYSDEFLNQMRRK